MIQEGLQVISGIQILGWNTVFDLGLDSLGALIGFGVMFGFRKLTSLIDLRAAG
jgi:hypothetical protein